MDKTTSTTVADSSKAAIPRRQANIIMVQNIFLIWLDSSIDVIRADAQPMMAEIRRVIHNVHTFSDRDQSIDFLTDIDNDKAFMIVSSTLCQNIVPLVHDVAHLHTIFIQCTNKNKNRYEQWAKDWPKIKCVFTDIESICAALKKAAYQSEQNDVSISFVAPGNDVSVKNVDQLNCSFMYTQIIKEILLTIKFEEKHITEFIEYARDELIDNEGTLKNINKLEQEYHKQTPIWWYTSEYLLYSVLNRALRTMEVDTIIRMGFFINDLHIQIQKLHMEQFSRYPTDNLFKVYRGQGMSKVDFDQLMKTKGGLMSFNNFLSTSKTQEVSLLFAESNSINPDFVGILFAMTIDPTKSITPFASVSDVSCFEEEDEVLFSMHTVFRIRDIKPIDENQRVFQVDLTLTDDNDEDLRVLTNHIREETFPNSAGWFRLGLVLSKMGQSEKAQQAFEVMLNQITDEKGKVATFNAIGDARNGQGEYKEAIAFCEKALAIQQQSLPPNHPGLATSYNNIGNVCDSMGEYSKALSFYEKSLAIRQQSLPPNHPDLAGSYNNIGGLYKNMGKYAEALSSIEKSLAIRQQSLPHNHPDLATSYNKIGNIYNSMGEYSKALSFYEKSLAIRQQSLPPNHPGFAASYNNIGNVCDDMGEHSKALSFYEKSLAVYQQSLPPGHPDLASTYNNIGNVHGSMGEYPKALSFYEKSLAIYQQSLPPNHPALAGSYNNIGTMHNNMGEYAEALSSYEKSLAIRQQSLPHNHPDLAGSYTNIGNMHNSMGEYSKALSFYEKSLAIRQKSLSPNHPILAKSYGNIGCVYGQMGEYSKALSYFETSLAIQQQSLSPNHPDLASSYQNVGSLCGQMDQYAKALLYVEKSLAIRQQSLPPNHPNLALSHYNIGLLYEKIGDYSKARSFYGCAVDIGQHSLPPNHLHLEIFRDGLDRIEKKL